MHLSLSLLGSEMGGFAKVSYQNNIYNIGTCRVIS
jgi:hypothetical protein